MHPLDPRIGAMVLLGGDAGLRHGKIMALEWTDLDFKRFQIHAQAVGVERARRHLRGPASSTAWMRTRARR